MGRYQTRPQVVEARRVPEDEAGMLAVAAWCGGELVIEERPGKDRQRRIEWGRGLIETARPGDYVVRVPEGVYLAWEASAFERTYVPEGTFVSVSTGVPAIRIGADPLDLDAAREDDPR